MTWRTYVRKGACYATNRYFRGDICAHTQCTFANGACVLCTVCIGSIIYHSWFYPTSQSGRPDVYHRTAHGNDTFGSAGNAVWSARYGQWLWDLTSDGKLYVWHAVPFCSAGSWAVFLVRNRYVSHVAAMVSWFGIVPFGAYGLCIAARRCQGATRCSGCQTHIWSVGWNGDVSLKHKTVSACLYPNTWKN